MYSVSNRVTDPSKQGLQEGHSSKILPQFFLMERGRLAIPDLFLKHAVKLRNSISSNKLYFKIYKFIYSFDTVLTHKMFSRTLLISLLEMILARCFSLKTVEILLASCVPLKTV